MKFNFTEKKIEVAQAVREYAEKKIGKIDKFFRTESDAFIAFSIEKGRHIVEVTIRNNGMFYRVKETTSDMFASIDSAVAAIERQIRKNKTRLEKRLRSGVFEVETESIVHYDDPETESEEEEESAIEIVRTKRFSIKPMSPEEAVLQMNLLGHEFFVFKNQDDDDAFAVVYSRKDGGYGLIESDD